MPLKIIALFAPCTHPLPLDMLNQALVNDEPLLHALKGIVVPCILDQQHLAETSGAQHR